MMDFYIRAGELLLALANAEPESARDVAGEFLGEAWEDGYNFALAET